MAIPYNGQLNQNLITASLYNMIISQSVFDINVATPSLADEFRTDGTLLGDTKLYYSADIGAMQMWASASERVNADRLAPNLLSLNRNSSPVCQSITMGEYFFTSITTDMYLSKNAFRDEGSFAQMIGVLKGSLTQIKKVYDNALINSTIGTHKSEATKANIVVPLPDIDPDTTVDAEAYNRLKAQAIMKELVILKANLEDNTRDYNELNFLRSYNPSNLIAVWNVEQKATITKMDLPTIFHKDGLEDTGLREYNLPSRWFGSLNTSSAVSSNTVRCSKTGWYNLSSTTAAYVSDYALATDTVKAKCYFLFAGDSLPSVGTVSDYARGITVDVASTTFAANYSYTVDDNILFVLVDKESLPFMSGFQTGTEFWNPLSLTTNNYLIFGHNELEFIKEKPFIKVSLASS